MIEDVIRNFDFSPTEVVSLGNAGGFSGSVIWKIKSGNQTYCLKRWPETFDDCEKIEWIHRVLIFAAANGCPAVTTPVPSRSGQSFVIHDNDFWELNHWASGTNDFAANPNQARIKSAVDTAIRFHQATARYQMNFAKSGNISRVLDQLHRIAERAQPPENYVAMESAFGSADDWRMLGQNAAGIAKELIYTIKPYESEPLPLQPIVRDFRVEHLFFENDQVTGLIDFGAMQVDSIVFDVSRLLGSMLADDEHRIVDQIDYYSNESSNPIAGRELIIPLNIASVLIGLANWQQWLFVEKRKFELHSHVQQRLSHLFRRLKILVERR